MSSALSAIGWIATALLLVAFGPQSYKVMKAKSAEGVSKITFPMVFIGSAMWAIYGSTIGAVQPWICNTVIVVLMIPTLYFIFKDNKLKMISIFVVGFAITLVALILFILVKVHVMNQIKIEWLTWTFVALAGAGTGLSYLPQMYQILKTKKIGEVSVATLAIVSLGNVFWVLYWVLSYVFPQASFSQTIILSIIWSVMGFGFQLPVIYLFIKQKQEMKKPKKMRA